MPTGTPGNPYLCLVKEDLTGSTDSSGEIRREYNIIGPVSSTLARFALVTNLVLCPNEHPENAGLYRDEVDVREGESLGDYTATVLYRSTQFSQNPQIGFEKLLPGSSASGSVRIKSALAIVSSTAVSGETPINTYGMIGATKDGVEGIDEDVPSFTFGLERTYAKGTITISLMAQIFQFHKRFNSAPWRGFAVGEVLLKAYDFDNNNPDGDKIRYYFECSPNQSNVVFKSPAGNITVPLIRGWDYVDISLVDSPGGEPYKVAHTVHVLETKYSADLNVII